MTLKDHGFNDPQIEVLSESPRLEMLQSRLRQAGLRPIRANHGLQSGTIDPFLIDTATINPGDLRQIAQQWVESNFARPLIMLGPIREEYRAFPIMHLHDVDQLSSLRARLTIRQRETRRKREFGLRVETARKLGMPTTAPTEVKSRRILYLGESSAGFIALKTALKNQGIDTVAALTAYTAKDYLQSGPFDATVLSPTSPVDEAAQFLADYDPLAPGPAARIVLLERPVISKQLSQRDLGKVSAIVPVSETAGDIASAIASQIQEFDGTVIQPAQFLGRHDGQNADLYPRAFLESHLDAQFVEADETGEALSLLSIAVSNTEMATELASLVRQMLRDADLVAQLDAAHICISLPATPYRGAISFARRIEEVWTRPLHYRAVERRQFHTVSSLLSALVAKPVLRRLKQA